MQMIASTSQLRAELIRWSLVLCPGIVLLGFLSATVGSSGPDNPWFVALAKPAINPPPIAFPIVWTALYIMMGFALALVVTASGARGRRLAVGMFVAQLALNLAWSPLFFGLHRIWAGLMLIIVLDLVAIGTVVLFAKVRKAAAWLMVPYIAWLLFASLLNWQFWQMNPLADGQRSSGAVTKIEF